jgi:hypothetical protein
VLEYSDDLHGGTGSAGYCLEPSGRRKALSSILAVLRIGFCASERKRSCREGGKRANFPSTCAPNRGHVHGFPR